MTHVHSLEPHLRCIPLCVDQSKGTFCTLMQQTSDFGLPSSGGAQATAEGGQLSGPTHECKPCGSLRRAAQTQYSPAMGRQIHVQALRQPQIVFPTDS